MTVKMVDKMMGMTHSPNDKDLGQATGHLLSGLDSLLNRLDQKILVGVGNLSGQSSTLGVSQLPSPVLDGQGRTSIASRETESCK